MKKILLISDTHGHLDEAILKYVKQADEVWHAGDIGIAKVTDELTKLKPIRAVYGNIDGHELRSIFKEDLRFNCEGVEVFMTHIGGYPESYNPRVRKLLQRERPKLFICGHSHVLKVMSDKKLGILHMNPGAAGVYGFHKIRTMLRFTLDKGKIENLEVVELGDREEV